MPDLDPLIRPGVRVHTAREDVKGVAVRGRVTVGEGAAGVVATADGALLVAERARDVDAGVDGAALGGVEGVLVDVLVVDALEDVDFASVGPVRADGPPSRPDASGLQ